MDRVMVRQVESMAGPEGAWGRGEEHEVEYGEALRLADAGIVAIVGVPVVASEAVAVEPDPAAIVALRDALGAGAALDVLAELAEEAKAAGAEIPADLATVVSVIDLALAAAGDAALAALDSNPETGTPEAATAAPEAAVEAVAATAEAGEVEAVSEGQTREQPKPAGAAPGIQRTRKPGRTETATAAPASETR